MRTGDECRHVRNLATAADTLGLTRRDSSRLVANPGNRRSRSGIDLTPTRLRSSSWWPPRSPSSRGRLTRERDSAECRPRPALRSPSLRAALDGLVVGHVRAHEGIEYSPIEIGGRPWNIRFECRQEQKA